MTAIYPKSAAPKPATPLFRPAFFALAGWLSLWAAHGACAEAPALVRDGAATVITVIDGDTVVMAEAMDGAREIRLVGIQAPKLPLDRPGFAKWPLADEAREALATLVRGRRVSLAYGGRRVDRHGRLLAHLFSDDDTWVQGELLKRGLARVYSFADNRAMVAEMLGLERAARAAGLGIWSHPFYAIRSTEEAPRHVGSFQLVEGRVTETATVKGRGYVNFGANWRTDFTISIAPKHLRRFVDEGVRIEDFAGRRIRVRGWLKSFNGPMIEASHPEQIEILDP